MNDPAGDKDESQPKKFSRVPDWVITDWDEPRIEGEGPAEVVAGRDLGLSQGRPAVLCSYQSGRAFSPGS